MEISFAIDKQTLDDLNIFGKRGSHSVYSLFNTTHTRGGSVVLEEMFRYPLADAAQIEKRSSVIRYFQEIKAVFPFRGDLFDTVEYYLSNTDTRTKIAPEDDTLQRKFRNYMGTDTEYESLHKGIVATLELLNRLHDFLEEIQIASCPAWQEEAGTIQQFLSDQQIQWVHREKATKKLAYAKAAEYDHILRYVVRERLQKLLTLMYQLDVYMSIAGIATQHKFVFASVLPADRQVLRIEGMYHPLLDHPVANTLEVGRDNNVIFLTGANMAGKSTFMKTFGICIFLAHIGFPVPASKMEFSVKNGMFTTINLPDNLNMGYSHFYAEVLRVKKVAEQVAHARNLIVIFDELFRGTNVKDAYEATVAVTEAFAANHNCIFVISTHIIEAGETLKEKCDNINFTYLPTLMKDNRPVYTYKLASGITNDRHGMMIINNEHIIEMLKSRKSAP